MDALFWQEEVDVEIGAGRRARPLLAQEEADELVARMAAQEEYLSMRPRRNRQQVKRYSPPGTPPLISS